MPIPRRNDQLPLRANVRRPHGFSVQIEIVLREGQRTHPGDIPGIPNHTYSALRELVSPLDDFPGATEARPRPPVGGIKRKGGFKGLDGLLEASASEGALPQQGVALCVPGRDPDEPPHLHDGFFVMLRLLIQAAQVVGGKRVLGIYRLGLQEKLFRLIGLPQEQIHSAQRLEAIHAEGAEFSRLILLNAFGVEARLPRSVVPRSRQG